MNDHPVQRKLAAILIADVVEYSRLMAENEDETLRALREHQFALINPTIGQHHGRVIKTMGDGILVEFQSVIEAVQCAVAIQKGMIQRNQQVSQHRQLRYRIGINLGDVLMDGDDIYGDGVNIASRLQQLAAPNGISISGSVFAQIDGATDHSFIDAGAHQLKNIASAVRVYHFSQDASAEF